MDPSLPQIPARIIRFGLFEVDLVAGELHKKGTRLKLQDQSHHILRVLLENPGEIVTRGELRKRLWEPDTFVDFDHSLNTAMMRLREALGDSPDNPTFIETLPRKGYRFIAPVHHDTDAGFIGPSVPSTIPPALDAEQVPRRLPQTIAQNLESAPAARPPRWPSRYYVAVVLVLVLSIVAAAAALKYKTSRPSEVAPVPAAPQIRSLVVLPMENIGGDRSEEYFADGMTDELIASLARITSIRVLSRTTSMRYKGTRETLSQIAQDLNVDAVVEGTVLRSGSRVRFTVELIQISTDRHLWADTYEGPLTDILGLENRVAGGIVEQISNQLTPRDKIRLAKLQSVNPDAYEDYLKGLFYWNKRSSADLQKAISYFRSATEKDPNYALAYAGLADCYGILGAAIVGTVRTSEVASKAEAAAIRAVELDSELAETQTALATVQFNYKWDWPAAQAGFLRAIQLNPNYATAHQRYSLYLIAMGKQNESIAEMERARALDPLSRSVNFSLGWRLYMARHYGRAIKQLQDTIEMDPSLVLPHVVLAESYEQAGEYDKAIAELKNASTLSHDSPPVIAALGHVYATAGKKPEAIRILSELQSESSRQYVSPFYVALVYEALGNDGKAMDLLEKAYDDRSNAMVFADVDPQLDSLRSEPRFMDLMRRLGLRSHPG